MPSELRTRETPRNPPTSSTQHCVDTLEIIHLSRRYALASDIWRCVAYRCEPQATEDTPLAGIKLGALVQTNRSKFKSLRTFCSALRIAVDGVSVMADNAQLRQV